MMGADTSSSGGGGIALTSSNIDKLAVIHDGGGRDILNNLYGSDDDDDIISKMQRRSVEQQAIVVGFAGDAADADRLAGTLKIHTQVREYEAGIGNDVICTFDGDLYDDQMTMSSSSSSLSKSRAVLGTISPSGLDAESIAYFARKEIATRMRSRQPLQLCLLVGGMVRCASSANYSKIPSFHERVQKQVSAASLEYSLSVQSNTNNERHSSCNMEDPEKSTNTETSPILLSPKLFWLDQYGSLQNLSYGCHGFGSNFALSVLDQGFRMGMSRQEAECLIRECFEQLRQRYLINSPQPPRIKCIDAFGVREMK